jgi:hypothetical protein
MAIIDKLSSSGVYSDVSLSMNVVKEWSLFTGWSLFGDGF